MKRRIQLSVNATNPHDLCDFWAATLGLSVVVDEAFVQKMVDEGHASAAETTLHNGVLSWADGAAADDPDGELPRMYFQRSDEVKQGRNRLHLDVQVGPDNRENEVDRIVGLGAERLWGGSQGPHSWTTLADPEGNEFCVS